LVDRADFVRKFIFRFIVCHAGLDPASSDVCLAEYLHTDRTNKDILKQSRWIPASAGMTSTQKPEAPIK
jgi:hypothetical protein